MACIECGQRFIIVGAQISQPSSETWRKVGFEHQDDKHDGRSVAFTVTFSDGRVETRRTSD